jgi:hypothetical protein
MINSHKPIYAPIVNLFAFQLRETPPWDLKDYSLNEDWLIQKYRQILEHFYSFRKIELPQALWSKDLGIYLPDYCHKLKLEQEFLGTIRTDRGLELISGSAYPQLMDDTYIMALQLRSQATDINEPISIEELQHLNPKGCFSFNCINSNLGQTLVINALLAEGKYLEEGELRLLAEECLYSFYGLLTEQEQPVFTYSANLFNGYVFGYTLADYLNKYNQVLVCFFFRQEDLSYWQNNTYQLSRLFLYQHKIIFAYRQLYYKVKIAHHKLTKLNNYSPKVLTYSTHFLGSSLITPYQDFPRLNSSKKNQNPLERQLNLIQDNATIYKQIILEIRYYQNLLSLSKHQYSQELQTKQKYLGFFLKFWQVQSRDLPRQIEAYLTHIEKVNQEFQQLIEITEAAIETEKRKRKKNRKNTLIIVAVGSVVGSVVAISNRLKNANEYIKTSLALSKQVHQNWHFVTQPIIHSISMGFLAAIITFVLIKLWQRSKMLHN